MKKCDPKEIGYYGRPITDLTRNELLEAFAELTAIIHECLVKDKKIEEFLYVKKNSGDEK
jgi:hypothetical protein